MTFCANTSKFVTFLNTFTPIFLEILCFSMAEGRLIKLRDIWRLFFADHFQLQTGDGSHWQQAQSLSGTVTALMVYGFSARFCLYDSVKTTLWFQSIHSPVRVGFYAIVVCFGAWFCHFFKRWKLRGTKNILVVTDYSNTYFFLNATKIEQVNFGG